MRRLWLPFLVWCFGCVGDAPPGQGPDAADAGGMEATGMDAPEAEAAPPIDPTWTLALDAQTTNFRAVAVDPSGNIYIAGNIGGSLMLDGVNVQSGATIDVLILKLDGKTKKAIWGVVYGGPGIDEAEDMVFDNGALLVVGTASGQSINLGSTNLMIPVSSTQTTHSWFARIDPANGAVVWALSPDAERTPNAVHESWCSSIALRNSNVSIGCYYSGANFGWGNVYAGATTNNGVAVFHMTLSSMSVSWKRSFTGSERTFPPFPQVAIDAAGDTWLGGGYTQSSFTDVEMGGDVFSNAGGPSNLFVLKLADGNQAIGPSRMWKADKVSMIVPSQMRGLAVSSTAVYATGQFAGMGTFPSGAVTSKGLSDLYVVKLGLDLAPAWQVIAGGGDAEYGWGAVPDPAGNVYAAFVYGNGVSFGTLMSSTMPGAAVGKIDPTGKPVAAKTITSKTAGVNMADIVLDSNVIYAVGNYGGDTTFDDGTMKLAPMSGNSFFIRRPAF